MGDTTIPVPVHWSDGTYAVVRCTDIPSGVMRTPNRSDIESVVEMKGGWAKRVHMPDADDHLYFAKVKIEDMIKALQGPRIHEFVIVNVGAVDPEASVVVFTAKGPVNAITKKSALSLANRKSRFPNGFKIRRAWDVFKEHGDVDVLVRSKHVVQADVKPDVVVTIPRPKPAPAPRYDGLTMPQCYQKMVEYNMEDLWGRRRKKPPRDEYMTPKQWEAAREAWKAQLADRQAEVARKEKYQVRVDLEFEEWE